jgi:hypothetical protein
MTLEKILLIPTSLEADDVKRRMENGILQVKGWHESVLRSYHILDKVCEMVTRGDSKETILEVVALLRNNIQKSEGGNP